MTDLADALTRMGVGTYDRSKVQKMTVKRKVSKAEAEAISTITGFALTPQTEGADLLRKYQQLRPDQRTAVARLLDVMLAEGKASGQ
nr:hypothetical protein DWF04_22515 [Cereibacter sphaeroides f. sp. denitrificans]